MGCGAKIVSGTVRDSLHMIDVIFGLDGGPLPEIVVTDRTQTVEAGLPELRDRKDFYLQVADELKSAGLMSASLNGMVSPTALMDRLTSRLGRQLVEFVRQPAALSH
jgi:hypothetical protein